MTILTNRKLSLYYDEMFYLTEYLNYNDEYLSDYTGDAKL